MSPENTYVKCWLKGFAMSTELETTFRSGGTLVAVSWLLDGIDICSGTLLTLSLSLKIDQNRLGFSLISCSNDSKNLVRLSRIMCLAVDRNCLNLARKQGGRMLYLLSYSFPLSYHMQDISSYPRW